MRTRAVGLATAALLVFSATADAKIVLGVSVHGVKVGMMRQQVRVHLGRGTRAPDNPDIFTYQHGAYQVIYARGLVTSVETFKASERTSNGLGVGTTMAKLRKRQRGLHCVSGSSGDVDCYVGSNRRGHIYTDFYLGNGKTVSGVVVGAGYL